MKMFTTHFVAVKNGNVAVCGVRDGICTEDAKEMKDQLQPCRRCLSIMDRLAPIPKKRKARK